MRVRGETLLITLITGILDYVSQKAIRNSLSTTNIYKHIERFSDYFVKHELLFPLEHDCTAWCPQTKENSNRIEN